MVDILERPSAEFQGAAASSAPKQSVTISIDVEVLKFIQSQGLDIAEHLNGLARFYMDTSQQKDHEAELDGWEPGEFETLHPPRL